MAKKQKKQKLMHQESLGRHIRKNWKLYSFAVIPILWYIIFKYIPMLGNIIAFRRYRGGPNIFGEYWVGFRYFEQFITDKSFWNAFWNTLRLSIEYLLVRFPATLIFAILINEIRNLKWKDCSDHFLSASFRISGRIMWYGKRTDVFERTDQHVAVVSGTGQGFLYH